MNIPTIIVAGGEVVEVRNLKAYLKIDLDYLMSGHCPQCSQYITGEGRYCPECEIDWDVWQEENL